MDTTTPSIHGQLTWIGLRPGPGQSMEEVQSVACDPSAGLMGDCYSRPDGPRQVTIIAEESLRQLAQRLHRDSVAPAALRRNLAIAGCRLNDLIGREFTIGTVRLLGTLDCPPCARMDQTLGPGGRDAMAGLGGICARILTPGTIQLGDAVQLPGA